MEVMFERVAGLDVGKKSVTACVRTPGPRNRRQSQTRTFSTMSRSLSVMADWLVAEGVTVAALESTATYWKPVFYCFEERMDTWLLNAFHMKAVPGRKTDVKDAEWIAQLLEHGLLRPSFVPPPDIRHPADADPVPSAALWGPDTGRHQAGADAGGCQHQAVGGRLQRYHRLGAAMLAAMVGGERDPAVLAQMAKGRMRIKIPQLTEALTGHFDAGHARLVAALLHRLDHVDRAIVDLNKVIAEGCRPWQHQIDLLKTIPGVGEKVAQVIIAETGGDMSRFATAAHLASWAGVAPAVHESAGHRTPAGSGHGNKWLTAMLVEAAGSVARSKGNYLSAQYARLTARRGGGRAQVAVAHSILVCAYYMLQRDEPYHDLGVDWLRCRDDQAHTRRLVAQLERLGHTVVLNPTA